MKVLDTTVVNVSLPHIAGRTAESQIRSSTRTAGVKFRRDVDSTPVYHDAFQTIASGPRQ
jgi:hypothetical protein